MKEKSKLMPLVDREVVELRRQLKESQETLEAIREGAVDALVVAGEAGEKVFTLKNADRPYRLLLEKMSEGALTVTADGLILFCNRRFADMLKSPLNTVVGGSIFNWINPTYRIILESMLRLNSHEKRRAEISLNVAGGETLIVYLSASQLRIDDDLDIFCLVATDLSEEKKIEELAAAESLALAALNASRALEKSLEESIRSIANTVESRDEYTAGHMKRVGQLASSIAKELGLSEDTIHGIELAATIHDVGKIAIPVEILTKPGKLSKVEYMLVQTHVEAGYNIIKNIEFPWPIGSMILQHHERMDGSGYPQGLKGDEILLGSRIIAIADVIEAISTHRPYRFVVGIDAALEEIKANRGSLYDAASVDACLRLFTEKRFGFI
ncbi:MAG: HD domain-containing phosphohydrolase [Pseudomonadota bacterium]